MGTVESFKIDHSRLLPGIYVSRKDRVGVSIVTTFDIRMKLPNKEPAMEVSAMHTIEHLGATFLRNDIQFGDKIVYFGGMFCRTGFYLVMSGDYSSRDIVSLITEMFDYISSYEGDIPGGTPEECGNYIDHNLNIAKYYANEYLVRVLYSIKEDNLVYPE